MTGIIFLKKELKEILNTSKIFIIPAVFLFFALSSPLSAKYVNEIIKTVGGINITLPEPTYLDSYLQFFKNFNTICLLILVISFMGSVIDEKTKGSIVLVLTKKVSRAQFILCKFIAPLVFYTLCYGVSVLGCLYYTYLLFPQFYNDHLPIVIFLFWTYGVLLISITIFASTVSKSNMGSGIIAIGGFIIMPVTPYIPWAGKYMPGRLNSILMEILSGNALPKEAYIPLTVTFLAIIAFVAGSIFIIKNQEI